jgi:hypothetical protein
VVTVESIFPILEEYESEGTRARIATYWEYDLEAIINVIIYFHFITNVYISMLEIAMLLEHEIQRKTHMHVWKHKRKIGS